MNTHEQPNKTLKDHPAYKNCGGKLLAELIGGSHLYGLANEDSDIDYRGLFVARDKQYRAGLQRIESIVQHGADIDATYYEFGRYLELLRKSNTQVLEILFAPITAFTFTSDIFIKTREHRYRLFSTHALKGSLKGYVFSEMKLATGERSGQLGGKRKAAVEKYGFSPKNFVQILRLCAVGKRLFQTGEYMVDVGEKDPSLHSLLMEIKNTPEKFTMGQLKGFVDMAFVRMTDAMDTSTITWAFDADLAADLILESRTP